MKTNTILVRMAAASALLALQACDYTRAGVQEYDPWETYKLGSVFDCESVPQTDMRHNTENTPTPGFGCAHNSNITSMVANPEDLERSRTLTPADPTARQRVVDAYRNGEDTSVAPAAKGTESLIE